MAVLEVLFSAGVAHAGLGDKPCVPECLQRYDFCALPRQRYETGKQVVAIEVGLKYQAQKIIFDEGGYVRHTAILTVRPPRMLFIIARESGVLAESVVCPS